MEKKRVHEIAQKLGIGNRDILEFLKSRGIEIRSHMSSLTEEQIAMLEGKFGDRRKEHRDKLDTNKTEDKAKQQKSEEGNKDGAQAQKKKKEQKEEERKKRREEFKAMFKFL